MPVLTLSDGKAENELSVDAASDGKLYVSLFDCTDNTKNNIWISAKDAEMLRIFLNEYRPEIHLPGSYQTGTIKDNGHPLP